jgi:ActR/RegA family two-component response regulator
MHMRPVLLMVDDDPQVVRSIERDLRRRITVQQLEQVGSQEMYHIRL